ncbi:MAG: hypothetical protein LBC09_07635, partial [Helicobacteraceae bacterium]|nr:hypothetical protein [Helicobacteraceae bacterium]
YFFDQACKIERQTIGYKNTDKICKRIIDGKYNEIAPVNLASVLDKNDIEKFKSDLNLTNNKVNKYYTAYFYKDGNHSYSIDYANEGKKHILLDLQYASGAGAGCDYNFLAVYNPQTSDKIRYIGENDKNVNFHPSVFGICAANTREELISIDKKNYLLVSGSSGLISLNEIARSEDGGDRINAVCDFAPIYSYE